MSRKRRENRAKNSVVTGNKKNLLQGSSFIDVFLKILIIAAIGFVPLLIRCQVQQYISPKIDPILYFYTTGMTDYYTYLKLIVLLVISLLLITGFVIKVFYYRYELSSSLLNTALAVFALSLITSTVLSNYKTIALWGGYARNFGLLAYLACIVLLLVAAGQKWDPRWYSYALSALYIFVAVNAALVLLDFLGCKLIEFDMLRALINGEVRHFESSSSRLAGTLGHNNFMSGAGGFLFAVFAAKGVLAKKSKLQICDLLAAVLAGIIVYGTDSLSGVVTLVFSAILLLGWLILNQNKKGIFLFAGLILTVAVSWTLLGKYNPSFLKDIGANLDILALTAVAAGVLLIAFFFWSNRERIGFRRIRMAGAVAGAVLVLCLALMGPLAANKLSGQFKRLDNQIIAQDLQKNEFALPEYGVAWGSGRIYIWKETLKLVAQKPLFGYGLDTLAVEFKQGDPAKIAGLENPRVIVDKPHNTYLNLLYGSGIIAFASYIAIILAVIEKSAKAITRKSADQGLLLPVLLGVLAFLYQGIFNDPVQGLEPVFWTLAGLCYSLASENRPSLIEDNKAIEG